MTPAPALQQALDAFDYAGFRAAQARDREQGRLRGLGICVYTQMAAVGPSESAEVRVDGGGWEARPASFAWPLHAGENRLEARAVNAMGRAGAVSSVEVSS